MCKCITTALDNRNLKDDYVWRYNEDKKCFELLYQQVAVALISIDPQGIDGIEIEFHGYTSLLGIYLEHEESDLDKIATSLERLVGANNDKFEPHSVTIHEERLRTVQITAASKEEVLNTVRHLYASGRINLCDDTWIDTDRVVLI